MPATRTRRPIRSELLYLGPDDTKQVSGGTMTLRTIGAPGWGRTTWIGWVIHRDYDSGHPAPWEVMKGGGSTWGWFLTEEAAHAGAAEYAAAFVAEVRKNRGFVDLHELRGPAEQPADDQPMTAARTAAHIRRLLDQHPADDVHGLRRAIEQYADALVITHTNA